MAQNPNGQRHDRSALILYGSETGNSQEVAEELGRVAERLHFMTRVTEMDSIELKQILRFAIVVFVTSTTGQGEFPKNAQKFWKSLLRKRLPPDCLSHVAFTTFGLGDSSYAQFNYAARKLHKRLEQLGAKEIYPRGEADERHDEGIEGTFLSWAANFNKHLLSTFPLPEGVEPIPPEVLLPPKILLSLRKNLKDHENLQDSQSATLPSLTESKRLPPSARDLAQQTKHEPTQQGAIELSESNPTRTSQDHNMLYEPPEDEDLKVPDGPACPMLKGKFDEEPETFDSRLPSTKMLPMPDGIHVKLVKNERVTPLAHWQDVRLLKFIVKSSFGYFVGDTMTIYPKNFPEDVQALIDLMGWDKIADEQLVFNNTNFRDYGAEMAINNVPEEPVKLPRSTLRDLLTHNLDITAIPKRRFFQLAANHTDDPVHKARLQEFASVAYTDEYYDYATRPRRSILEVLQDFPSVKFPFQWALAVFPYIRGRAYSICSSSHRDSQTNGRYIEIEILVALVKYKTVLKKVRQGLCSRYLASLKPNTLLCTILSVTRLSSPWVLNSEKPEHVGFPVICVAPGTGIAPCRALLWHRALLEWSRRERSSDIIDFPVGKAYLFFGGRNRSMDFFFKEELKSEDLFTTVFTAFSRDQEKKRYVQDVLKEQGQLIADLILNQGARIFVCGSSGNMPKAVRAAFVDLIERWDKEERGKDYAEAVVANLEKLKRYTQETW